MCDCPAPAVRIDIVFRTTGSAILWGVILEFEVRVGELQRAKKLLYRAVNECPLAKGEYIAMSLKP
jgi:hypothetical protein